MRAVSPRRRMRLFAYAGVTSGIVLVFALAEWGTAKYVFDRSPAASTALEIGLVLLAALVFQPFHRRAEAAVESAFSRRRRLAIESLSRFRSELTSFKDAHQLLRRVVDAVTHHTELAAIAVYLRREHYRAEASSFDSPIGEVELDDPLIVRLRSTGAPAAPRLLKSAALGSHAFPMTVAGDLIGFLCVEPKYGELEAEEAQTLALLSESLALALVELDPHLRAPEREPPNNLPADLSPLIGRGEEITELKKLLEHSRLVTLTGAGGVGKTRLALHVASESRAHADGMWLVDLAPVYDASFVPNTIAKAFGIVDEGGNAPLIERVASYLKNRQVLVVLDNCEHLITGVADAAEYLLQRCARLQIVATSREPLGLSSEEVYRVPSLSVPTSQPSMTADQAMNASSVMLFAARARSVDHTFTLSDENAGTVAEIVRRLDGIPLAIELAAPRLKVLTVEQLRARLDERFELLTGGSRTALPRHQTLRALITWSFDLLSDSEKELLRRCAVLRGSWSLDAATALSAGSIDDWRTLDLLEALADKSLLVVQQEGASRRFRMLESTREFALEQLERSGERGDVTRAYLHYYSSLARAAGDAYWMTDSDAWSARINAEVENYRGAIVAGLAQKADVDAAASIIGSLRWFWYTAARREGATLVEHVRSDDRAAISGRNQALLALTAALLDTSAKASAPAAVAAAFLDDGTNDVAWIEARVLKATALGRAGRITESCIEFDEALLHARNTRQPRLLGWALGLAAYWHGALGESSRARAFFDEAADVLRDSGDAWQVARLHVHRADFLFTQAEAEAALESVRKAEAIFRERGAASGLSVALLNATAYLLALGRLEEGWDSAREGLRIALDLDHPMARAWAVGHFGEIAAETGDWERSALLLGHADAIYTQTGGSREPTERRGYDRAVDILHAHLGGKEMAERMRAGANADVEIIAREAFAIPRPKTRIPVLH